MNEEQEQLQKQREELSDSIANLDLSPPDVDRAVESSLLVKLRRAVHYMPDGTKAQKPSVIGKMLGDAQLLEVWARLAQAKKTGRPCYDALAFRIQEEWGILKEMSRWHMVRALMFYEQRIFGLLGVAESVPELAEWTKSKEKTIKKIIEKVDGLDELADAIVGQRERIAMVVENEKRMKILMPTTFKEYRTLNSLVETYLKYQIELGYHKRQPIKLDIGVRDGFSAQSKQIDQTVGRDAMLSAAEKFIDMVKNQRNKFEIVEEVEPE